MARHGEVIPSRRWRHSSGATASPYGAVPWTGAPGDRKEDWRLENVGWTIAWDDGTVGIGRVPFPTQAEAQDWLDREHARLAAARARLSPQSAPMPSRRGRGRQARETGRRRMREGDDWRKYSMTYGQLPPFERFSRDISTRTDPESSDGRVYWPKGTVYPMELVGSHEIELAEGYGGLEEFEPERRRTGRHSGVRGFQGNERQIYGFLGYLVDCFNDGDDEAGDLASSIMTTLGYEWI